MINEDCFEDGAFIWYVETHSKTERALFNGSDTRKLLRLAGKSEKEINEVKLTSWYQIKGELAESLIKKAKLRIGKPILKLIQGGKCVC